MLLIFFNFFFLLGGGGIFFYASLNMFAYCSCVVLKAKIGGTFS